MAVTSSQSVVPIRPRPAAASTDSVPDRHGRIAVRIFFTCWLLYALHFATNTVREIYPALSLGDHLSFDVSEYLGLHPDIFELPGRGVFINNNPGASIVGAVPYVITRPLIDRAVEMVRSRRAASPAAPAVEYDSIYPMAREFYREARARGFDVKFGLGAAVMQALAMAPLSAFSAVVLFYLLVYRVGSGPATALALLYAVATPIFYRTAQLNHNLIVAHCALFAFAVLWRPWSPGSLPTAGHYLLSGLLAGWAVVCDYSGLIVVIAVGGYALARWLDATSRSPAALGAFGLGLSVSALILMAYQQFCFGNALLPAQHFMPAATYTHLGYSGMDWPHFDLLWETAFSLRYGLFTSAPLLLLALYPGAWSAGTRLVGKREAWFIAGFCLLFFLFCSANQYGRMQFNSGVRHVVPVSAFLFLIAAGPLLRLPAQLGWAFGIVCAYCSWCLAMYRDVEQGLGIPESLLHVTFEGFQLPWMRTLQGMGYLSSQASATPLLVLSAALLWALWRPIPLPRIRSRRSGSG